MTSRPCSGPTGGTRRSCRPRTSPARLRSLAPEWAPYRSINGLEIRRYLDAEHGVKVATTGRRYPVDPGVIRDAIARRDATRDADGLG
jgi:S-DNA-T family DNA segregation ATPase FtsK/SpoIIIE